MKTLINTATGHMTYKEGSKRPYQFTKNGRTVSFSTLKAATAAQAKHEAEELDFAAALQEARRA